MSAFWRLAPKECFLSAFWRLFWALRASCQKALKKPSVGHFRARAPGHSCKWRPGSQPKTSGKKKAHKLLTHKLFEKAVNPGTTSRLTRRERLFSGFGGEHIAFFCPVLSSPNRAIQVCDGMYFCSSGCESRDAKVATPPTCYRSLSGPSGPNRGSVRRGVPGALWAPGSGVSKKRPESVPGVSKRCLDTPGTLSGHFLDTPEPSAQSTAGTPRRTLPRTPPIFGDTLGDTPDRETPVAGRRYHLSLLAFFPPVL